MRPLRFCACSRDHPPADQTRNPLLRAQQRLRRRATSKKCGGFRSALQAKASSGSRAVSILSDSNFTFWTRTVWNDEAALRSFMLSGAHKKVMPRLLEWCDEAAVVHWLQESQEPPPWQEAHRRMQKEGRRSKVNHPSEAQERFEIPQPRTTAELRLK